jgi:hypothetical protein
LGIYVIMRINLISKTRFINPRIKIFIYLIPTCGSQTNYSVLYL